MISFEGRLIKPTTVIRQTEKGTANLPVYFVELNKNNSDDVAVIMNIAKSWGRKNMVRTLIEKYTPCNMDRVFLLTRQNANFKKLKPEDVLGFITSQIDSFFCYITRLQTHPEYKHSKTDRSIKGIGKTMLDMTEQVFIKDIQKSSVPISEVPRCMEVNSLKGAIKFYEHNGFERRSTACDSLLTRTVTSA